MFRDTVRGSRVCIFSYQCPIVHICMASVGFKYDAVVSFYVAADVSFRRTELIYIFEK